MRWILRLAFCALLPIAPAYATGLTTGHLPIADGAHNVADSGYGIGTTGANVCPANSNCDFSGNVTFDNDVMVGAAKVVTSPSGGSLVNGNLAVANGTNGITDSGISATASLSPVTATSGSGPINCPNPYGRMLLTNDGTTVTLSATPYVGCSLLIQPNLIAGPFRINFNGVPLRMYGFSTHDLLEFTFATKKANATCEIHYTGIRWESGWCDAAVLANSLPTGLPIGPNGSVQLTYSSGDGGWYVKPYKGEGFVESNLYTQRVLPTGLFLLASSATSSATSHIYAYGGEILIISAVANSGGHIRLTVAASGIAAGEQGDIITAGLTCFDTANAFVKYTGVDATHVDLPDVSSTGLSSSCPGVARTLYLYASANGHAPDAWGVEIESGGLLGTWVGDVVEGAAHAVTSTFSAYNGCDAITGALKSNGDGTCQQAAVANLSDGGTAGTKNTGTSGGTVPLLNGNNTWSGVQTFGDGDVALSGATSGTAIIKAPAISGGTNTLPTGTHTLIGRDTPDTLTNKIYDTAGAGNSFSINSLAATANTGTGSVVRDTSPTLVTPALGTPSSGNLSNTTNIPAAQLTGTVPAAALPNPSSSTLGGVESKAAVSHQFLNTISTAGVPGAAQPAAADLSDGTTGSGAVVQATSPTVTTPTISGALTYGGVALTANVTGTGKMALDTSPTISAPTLSGITTLTGHEVSSGTALACGDLVFGTGAGTSPTCTSVTGDDHRVTVSFSTGTSPTAGQVVFTITFKSAYASAPNCLLGAGNTGMAGKIAAIYLTTTTSTEVLNSTLTNLTASTAYIVSFQCVG